MTRKVKDIKRIVIKIGTSLLTKEDGSLNSKYFDNLASQVIKLKKLGKEIIIVSSGAIGAGIKQLKLKSKPKLIPLRQACAAAGQAILMQKWQDSLNPYKVAQIMLTYENFSNRRTYLNLRNSINTLLKMDVIPIINENDPVSVHEIEATFGDNDKLSAMVASKIEADLLILLSDIPGLCTKNPRLCTDATLIRTVEKITPEIEKMGGRAGSSRGIGGMLTKIHAAKIAYDSGYNMIIAKGDKKDVLLDIIKGEEVGTLFVSSAKLSNKQRWITFSKPKGDIVIDDGAEKALLKRKSLLPSGIRSVKGNFDIGDVVNIKNKSKIIAHGLTDYNKIDIDKIKGKQTNEIEKILGYKNYDNIVRNENIIILKEK